MNLYYYWEDQILGIAATTWKINLMMIVFIVVLAILIWLNPRISRRIRIVAVIASIYMVIAFLISPSIAENFAVRSWKPQSLARIRVLQLRDALTSYYKTHNKYPPFDGFLDSLNSELPGYFECVNPYTGARYTRVLNYDSVLGREYKLKPEELGLIAYKVSEDGQSCIYCIVDFDVWTLGPTRLERGKLKPLW